MELMLRIVQNQDPAASAKLAQASVYCMMTAVTALSFITVTPGQPERQA